MAPTIDQQQLYFNQLQSSLNGVYTHIGRVFDAAQRKGDSGVMGQSKIIITTFRNNFHDALDEIEYELNRARTVMRRDLALHVDARRRKEEEERAKLNPPPVPEPEVTKKEEDAVMADAPAADDAGIDVDLDDLFESKPSDPPAPAEDAPKDSVAAQIGTDQAANASKEQPLTTSASADAAMTDAIQPSELDNLQPFDLDAAFDEIAGGKADEIGGGQEDGGDMGDFLSGLENYGNMDTLGADDTNANNDGANDLIGDFGDFLNSAVDDAAVGDPNVDNTFDDLFTFGDDDFGGEFGDLGSTNNNNAS